MEQKEIVIYFADLRRLAETVPVFLAKQVGARATPALRAELEYALAITGLDTELLLLEFAEAYGVDITAFDFNDVLLPDGPDLLDTLLFFPVVIWLLVGGLLKILGNPLSRLFPARLAQRMEQQLATIRPPKSRQPLLTIGDFVASAAAGRFVRREQVYFQLRR
jgi:hypothetical protein